MSESPARVAVVVPVHNAAAYLEQTIDSILAQSFSGWKAFIVDDASSDGSDQIAARYEREHPGRIQTIRLDDNVGVAQARNIAIEASSGSDLIALLDHDDWWYEHYLERLVGIFDEMRAQGRRIGVASSDAHLFSPGLGFHERTWGEQFGWTDPVTVDAMFDRNPIHARLVMARAAYDEVGRFAPDCLGADDYDMWLRMLEAGWEVVQIPEQLFVWRWHPGSLGQRRAYMASAGMRVMERALARGRLTPAQQRSARRRVRHLRALRARALTLDALAERRPLRATGLAVRAVPSGVVAFAQRPDRWAEWVRGALGRGQRTRAF